MCITRINELFHQPKMLTWLTPSSQSKLTPLLLQSLQLSKEFCPKQRQGLSTIFTHLSLPLSIASALSVPILSPSPHLFPYLPSNCHQNGCPNVSLWASVSKYWKIKTKKEHKIYMETLVQAEKPRYIRLLLFYDNHKGT